MTRQLALNTTDWIPRSLKFSTSSWIMRLWKRRLLTRLVVFWLYVNFYWDLKMQKVKFRKVRKFCKKISIAPNFFITSEMFTVKFVASLKYFHFQILSHQNLLVPIFIDPNFFIASKFVNSKLSPRIPSLKLSPESLSHQKFPTTVNSRFKARGF